MRYTCHCGCWWRKARTPWSNKYSLTQTPRKKRANSPSSAWATSSKHSSNHSWKNWLQRLVIRRFVILHSAHTINLSTRSIKPLLKTVDVLIWHTSSLVLYTSIHFSSILSWWCRGQQKLFVIWFYYVHSTLFFSLVDTSAIHSHLIIGQSETSNIPHPLLSTSEPVSGDEVAMAWRHRG